MAAMSTQTSPGTAVVPGHYQQPFRGFVPDSQELPLSEQTPATFLGSTFNASSAHEYRLQRYQEQVTLPKETVKAKNIEKKTAYLYEFFPAERLRRVYQLTGFLQEPVTKEEAVTTVLCLYEIILFTETDQTLNKSIIQTILTTTIPAYALKKGFLSLYYHKRCRYLRALYEQDTTVFDFSTSVLKELSIQAQTLLSVADLEQGESMYWNPRQIQGHNSRSNDSHIHGPLKLSKLMVCGEFKQECSELAFRMARKQVTSELVTAEQLKAVGEAFEQIYLSDNKKFIKTTRYVLLALVKLIDPNLLEQVTAVLSAEGVPVPKCRDYANVYARHKAFFERILELVFQDDAKAACKLEPKKTIEQANSTLETRSQTQHPQLVVISAAQLSSLNNFKSSKEPSPLKHEISSITHNKNLLKGENSSLSYRIDM